MDVDSQPTTESQLANETPPSPSAIFIPPSIERTSLVSGASSTYFSPVPLSLQAPTPADASEVTTGPPCCLGVDEAGRGPVLGPMVYGVFYLPITLSDSLLRSEAHRFDDSKVLTPAFRSSLMRLLCTPGSDLHTSCGWATSSLSAQDISAGMLRPHGATYNLNAQAMDATVDLIKGVYARGVNVQEIYVDTIGQPGPYQAKLQRIFPTARITVAKKADSLYPSVSAASVCAKVTRDAALEVLWEAYQQQRVSGTSADDTHEAEEMAWGSGYPSDARCVGWLKGNMHPLFGWGPECRQSWGTAKDMLDAKGGNGVKVEWPVDDDGETARLTDFFVSGGMSGGNSKEDSNELGNWFGTPAGLEAF